MAINFPSSPAEGEEYTDPNSGTWVYDSGTNSWTLVAGGSTSAFNFRGGHDFRQSTPPAAPIESGDMWIHDAANGTIDGVYTGISGQIANGQLVLWDGNSYVMVSGTLPGYPDLGDGGGSTLDDRYVNATGDNMTGDLTLGTDKITLDATDGSATFAGGDITLNANGSAEFKGSVTVSPLGGSGTVAVGADNDGKLVPLPASPAPFTWNANDDTYTRTPVETRDISVQVRMRRCVVEDSGNVAFYLDADDSTKVAGDWIRLCETCELDTPNTGTFGAEVQNTGLRELAPTWSAGSYSEGAVHSHNGSVWQALKDTSAEPSPGGGTARIDGTAGQVMVEIPTFSVKHSVQKVGAYGLHEHAVALGEVKGGGYEVHPAFVRPDGTIRKHIYIGAYKGTGANGNGSASGVNNAVNFTRAAARNAMAGRGTGWHQYSYWQYNAIQHLYLAEYQDMNSQRVLGDGSIEGGVYQANNGLSNNRGNRCGHFTVGGGSVADYVSYRGIENFYGRAWDWIDGININERMVYLCNDHSKFADNTATDYSPLAMVPSASGSYQRDLMPGLAMLPLSVSGASSSTYVGDACWSNVGWRVAHVGGSASHWRSGGGLVRGSLNYASSAANPNIGGRLSYAD